MSGCERQPNRRIFGEAGPSEGNAGIGEKFTDLQRVAQDNCTDVWPAVGFCSHLDCESWLDLALLDPLLSSHGRGSIVQGAVWSPMVVELPPAFDQYTSLTDIAEPLAVEALIPQLAVEAFDKAVLPGPTWRM